MPLALVPPGGHLRGRLVSAARQALRRAGWRGVPGPLSGRKGSIGMKAARLTRCAGRKGDRRHRTQRTSVIGDAWAGISGRTPRLEIALRWGGPAQLSREQAGEGCKHDHLLGARGWDCGVQAAPQTPGGHGQGAWHCMGHSGSLCGIGRLGLAPSSG